MKFRGFRLPAWALALCVAFAASGALTNTTSGRSLDGAPRITMSPQQSPGASAFPILRVVGAGVTLLTLASQVAAWRFARS